MPMYRPVAPVYIRFMGQSILAFQSVSRNSEGHVESVEPIKCIFFYSDVQYILECLCVFVYILITHIKHT